MPVRMSSGSDGSVKISRKPRVAVGSSKGTGDGFRTPRSRDSDGGKGQRKVRAAVEESKVSSNDVRAGGDAKKKWSRNLQSRENGRYAVPYFIGNGNSSDMRGRGRSDSKMKGGSEEREATIDRNLGWKGKRTNADPGIVDRKLGWKGKRISDDPGIVDQATFDGNDKKSRSGLRRNVLNSFLDNDKKPSRKDYEFKESNRNKLLTERGKFRGSESLDKRSRSSKIGGVDKPKPAKDNELGNGSKIYDKRKAPLATQKELLNQRENAVGSVERPLIRRVQRKKLLVTDSDLAGERPKKKKKRGIRIDPYDTSNKRLDDSISDKGKNQVKIDKTESNDIEMSKNAQFRAICPSPSILSFVDDNLLGRRREIEFKRAGYNIELPAPLDNIPFSTISERERIKVPPFRNKLEFFAAAKISSSFPPPELPEIAFAGRSNVGKSSLLNALTRQWGVVRTSDKPGLTQTINFFKLGPKLCMVDLPGYGFAYAKEEVKEAWEELVKEYVMTRVGLKRVCLLIDTKWGMKPRDLELIDLMERYETKYQIVLTKTDLVFPIDVARRAMQIEEMMISSKTGAGIRSLRTVLAHVPRFVR